MKLNKKEQVLIDYIKRELLAYSGSLILYDSYMAQHRGKDYSSGYFEYPGMDKKIKRPRLHVATKRPKKEWLSTLLHEFCHFKQWVAQTDSWTKYGKEETLENTANLERECEKMTIDLIRQQKFDSIIDIPKYIEMANAYLLFYQIYAITDKWYEIPPFSNVSLRRAMPTKLIRKPFTYKMDDGLIGAYLRICYKRKK